MSGRIASFTGDELKIGGFYFGFLFICLAFFFENKKKLFGLLFLIFFIIAILIGERSNFFENFYYVFYVFTFFY